MLIVKEWAQVSWAIKDLAFGPGHAYLEHLLFLLSEGIGPLPDESWLNDVRDHWREQSAGEFSAWINPDLDQDITSEERQKEILALIEGVVSTPGVTQEVSATAQLMRPLLPGEITTTESSPLDYMVSGKDPYKWLKLPQERNK
jgi:hypothetical protein